VPGRLTSASLALRLALGDVATEIMPFDAILPAVASGNKEVGLLIHEGQLTYGQSGMHKVLDLGEWWMRDTGLPLPLGGNAIRKDLGERTIAEIGAIFKKSIEFGLSNRREALTYAMDFGRGIGRPLADRFVGMYVNDYTLDYGPRGRRAIEAFLSRGHLSGVLPQPTDVEFAALSP
jgi:1,4-dihydroxy-6-naphthoate synthase